MLQTFPKHQAGWSETVVNVPAAATSVWQDLTAENKFDYFYFFIQIQKLISAELTN
jgi:hypothetical protein